MKSLTRTSACFLRDDSGVTAIEYSLIASGVFLGIVAPVANLSDNLDITYHAILDYFAAVGV